VDKRRGNLSRWTTNPVTRAIHGFTLLKAEELTHLPVGAHPAEPRELRLGRHAFHLPEVYLYAATTIFTQTNPGSRSTPPPLYRDVRE
jgi:hypothetical protein